MNRKSLLITAVLALIVAGGVGASYLLAPSNIDPANKYSWSENAGWMNWRDADGSGEGVIVHADHLEGSIWMENAGWVNVGNGNGPYLNSNDTNYGVNISPNGDLDGYAWGENIGWIYFKTISQAPNQARFDAGAGRFRGYAWGENVGWINLDDATHYVAMIDDPEAPLGDIPDKTRFISFVIPPPSGGETALRVNLVSLHHVVPPYTGGPSVPFVGFEGEVRWVGQPTQYVESGANPVPFYAARLQCTPYYQDWTTVGLLHVTGSAITPSSVYEVENLAASCMGNEADCTAVSAPLSISTTRWGDVRTPYNPPDPSVQPDISDVSALVDKFRNAPGSPIKARGILAGAPGNIFGEVTHEVLNVDFGFSHISACVDAFRGVPYPYTISACP